MAYETHPVSMDRVLSQGPLLAPFPYFGGKSRVAEMVWERLGDVENYVEPFAGSAAVLLMRPDAHQWWDRTETINDADGMVANFWRAVQGDPDQVAHWADWPVNENDLHARHVWLVGQRASLASNLEGDPAYYDAKIAGWWVWGICCWIGSGFCSGNGPWVSQDGKLVHLGDDGRGHCAAWADHLQTMMARLADRLRRVRVCSGDWARVCGHTPTVKLGVTGVFLDPPYGPGRAGELYVQDSFTVAEDVRAWAVEHGADPRMRIALCGYEGDYAMPSDWDVVAWKARGGYGDQGNGRGKENRHREGIYFSPHCQGPQQGRLL